MKRNVIRLLSKSHILIKLLLTKFFKFKQHKRYKLINLNMLLKYNIEPEETIAAVKKLLPESSAQGGGDLASFCSWPDEIKHFSQWQWTSSLHYVNTPDYRCNYQYCRDCQDSHMQKDRFVTGAIFNYTSQLMSASVNSQTLVQYNLREALMFLSHYMGDVHQPLHTGFSGDRGGNTIIVHWYNSKTNLHHVWDDMIIESALKTYYNSSLSVMIQSLQAKLMNAWSNDVPSWESCQFNQTACPDQYASKIIGLACKYAYRNATPGTTLGDEYFLSRLPIVEKRLAQGGIRLAAILNQLVEMGRSFIRTFPVSEQPRSLKANASRCHFEARRDFVNRSKDASCTLVHWECSHFIWLYDP
ncbi:hypothetical protein Bca52824_006417 [Brassica carinata]|uniref:Aspergillus nuclease S1 n=1 Tax=Brassica carinata TaxID=52824 RepID=A0A8X7W5Y8_BRACI|nr:hypothetical protein Bca52824_006417 [Brassica carinata]